MADYKYTGTTSQNGTAHSNHLVAIKVDPAGTPKFTLLAETVAAGDGTFELQWADWDGRVIIGAVDDDGTIQKLDCIFHDFQTGVQVVTGETYESLTLSYGPAAYYRLDETSGTTAADSSGNGNDGTYNGSPTLNQTGLITDGTSVLFDGVDDYVSADSITTALVGSPLTYEIWGYKTNSTRGAFLGGHSNTGDNRLVLLMTETTRKFQAVIGVTSYFSDTTIVPLNTSFHVCLTYDGSDTIRLFLNSTEVTDGDFPITGVSTLNFAASDLFSIGQEYDSGPTPGDFFNGRLDEVAIYNRVLTNQEIEDHYNMGRFGTLNLNYSQLVLSDNPITYYKLDETSGTTVNDSSGNNYHGVHETHNATPQPPVITTGNSGYYNGSYRTDLGNQITLSNTMTFEAWVRTSTVPSGGLAGTVVAKFDSVAGKGIQLTTYDPGSGIAAARFLGKNDVQAAHIDATGTTDIADGLHHHLVGVVRPDRWELYVDGNLEATDIVDQLGAVDNTRQLTIGFQYSASTPTHYFTGDIDEVALYPRALTQQEIQDHYSLGLYGSLQPNYDQLVQGDAPVNYWKLDDASAPIVDSVGGFDLSTIGSSALQQAALRIDSTGSIDPAGDGLHNGTTNLESDAHSIKTVEMWCKFNDLVADQILVKEGGTGNGWAIGIKGDTDELGAGIRSNNVTSAALYPTSNIDINDSHYVAAIFDVPNQRIELYLDGALVGVNTSPNIGTHDGTCEFAIGSTFCPDLNNYQNPLTGGNTAIGFDGTISDVAVYSHALSRDKIDSHVIAGRMGKYFNSITPTVAYRFTANGSITVSQPTKVRVIAVGGGGAGGTFGGGGGGGGAVADFIIEVPTGTHNITIGLGAASTGTSAPGANGGTTQFGTLISATGGEGGKQGTGGLGGGDSGSAQLKSHNFREAKIGSSAGGGSNAGAGAGAGQGFDGAYSLTGGDGVDLTSLPAYASFYGGGGGGSTSSGGGAGGQGGGGTGDLSTPTAGVDGLGGGGGGRWNSAGHPGTAGGDGVVLLFTEEDFDSYTGTPDITAIT